MSKNCSALLEHPPTHPPSTSQRVTKLQVINIACWLPDLSAAVGPGVLSTDEIPLISYNACEQFWGTPLLVTTTGSQIQSM